MKNSFLVTLTTLLTFSSIGFISKPELVPIKEKQFINIDTSYDTVKLDSINTFKTKELVKYEAEIQNSLEVIENKKKEQEELSLSTDSIYNMVNIDNTLTKN